MTFGLEFVADKELEHEQNEVEGEGDEHGLVVDVGVALETSVGVSPPNVTAHRCSQDHHALPKPYWTKHRPVTPFNVTVQAQRKQRCKYHQTCVHQEFTEILRV